MSRVHHPTAVRVGEGVGDLAAGCEWRPPRESWPSRSALRAQRLAIDVRHHVIEVSAGVARVEHGEHVRVLQLRRDPDLAQKALAAERGREIGTQHLDCDLALVLQIAREVDRCHAAGAEFALDVVAAGECVLKPGRWRRQWSPEVGEGTR